MARQRLGFLSEEDRVLLDRVIARERRMDKNPAKNYPQDFQSRAPDCYIIQIPDEGIPAVVDGQAKSSMCKVWDIDTSIDISGTDKNVIVTEAEELEVFNFYPVKWYGVVGGEILTRAWRIKSGIWVCEKPPFILDCKPTVDVNPGESQPATIFIDGSDTTETETAWLDWTAGGEKISANTEARILYDIYKKKFTFLTAACEGT